MSSLCNPTGSVTNGEDVLSALCPAQIELVDCIEIVGSISIELTWKTLKKLFDSGGGHGMWEGENVSVDTGGRGDAAPGLLLVSERDRRGTATRAEKIFGELLDNDRVIALATENIKIGGVRIVCEMAADQRGRDQLHHGITSDAT